MSCVEMVEWQGAGDVAGRVCFGEVAAPCLVSHKQRPNGIVLVSVIVLGEFEGMRVRAG